MSLTEFLLERIGDDEKAAESVRRHEHLGARDAIHLAPGITPDGYGAIAITSGRVLAECAARRRIIEAACGYSPELEHGDNGEWAFDLVLRALATPFSDHPSFDPAWSTS